MAKRSARDREKNKGRMEEGGFFRLVHFVLRSQPFQALSPRAVKVFMALAAEYNNKNNGALALPRSQLVARGFGRNGNQAAKGLKELIASGFVICTRPGKIRVGPSYYALTIEPIDASDKHSFPAERVASHLWRRKNVSTETVQTPAPKACQWNPKSESTSTKTVPVDATLDPIPSTKTVHLYNLPSEAGFCSAVSGSAAVAIAVEVDADLEEFDE